MKNKKLYYEVAIYAFTLDEMKNKEYLILNNGKFILNKDKCNEDLAFWTSFKNVINNIMDEMFNNKKNKIMKIIKELDNLIVEIMPKETQYPYILLHTVIQLGIYLNECSCPKHILYKAQLSKFVELEQYIIDTLKDNIDRETFRNSKIFANIIKEYIEYNKIVKYEDRCKYKPKWATK